MCIIFVFCQLNLAYFSDETPFYWFYLLKFKFIDLLQCNVLVHKGLTAKASSSFIWNFLEKKNIDYNYTDIIIEFYVKQILAL